MYAHVFFAKAGYSPDPSSPEYERTAAFHKTHCKIVCLCIKYVITSLFLFPSPVGFVGMFYIPFFAPAILSSCAFRVEQEVY